MVSKKAALVAAVTLVSEAMALDSHRHANLHERGVIDKRKTITRVETDVVYVTVTVPWPPVPSSTKPPSISSSNCTTHNSTTLSSSTTLSTSVIAISTSVSFSNIVSSTPNHDTGKSMSSSALQTKSSSSSSGSSGNSGLQIGLAFNNVNFLSLFVASSAVWCYNWVATGGNTFGFEYVPMLHGSSSSWTSTWASEFKMAYDNGARYALSINEPDNAGQANLDPTSSCTVQKTYLEPLRSQGVQISSPCITSSNENGQGISWLKEFVSVCGLDSFDFTCAHWYGNAGVDGSEGAAELKSHLQDVYSNFGKQIWLTEWAAIDNHPIETSLKPFIQQSLANFKELGFVTRAAYFWVDGLLVDASSSSLSRIASFFN